MRLDLPRLRERFGAVLLYGMQQVYELDAGRIPDEKPHAKDEAMQRVPYETIHEALREMAIVVPVRGERLKLLDGVLAGIPHPAQIILVSNSDRAPIDRYRLEEYMLDTFSAYTRRDIVRIHQRDRRLANAFERAGYPHLLDDEGLVHHGKAEGMLIALAMAKLSGRRTIGFVDSDNYIPGSILEYCNIYAAGFAMAQSRDRVMVRVAWSSKPKIVESSLYFAKWGRSSVITNDYLNQLVSHYTGFETEVIRTGNAGEHALSVEMGLSMTFAAGYSVEPYQLVYLMEEYGGVVQPQHPSVSGDVIHIYQIESRNPHLHESKGEEHVSRMIETSLSVIYHSPLCPPRLKDAIAGELDERGIRRLGEPITLMRRYPPLQSMDFGVFREALAEQGVVIPEPQ